MVEVKEYLARQVAARINEFMRNTDSKVLAVEFSIDKFTANSMFTNTLVLHKLLQYGIHMEPINMGLCHYIRESSKFDNTVTISSERISNALCPNSKKMYDKNIHQHN